MLLRDLYRQASSSGYTSNGPAPGASSGTPPPVFPSVGARAVGTRADCMIVDHCALDLGVPFNCPNAPVPPAWEEGGVGTDAAARPAKVCYHRRRSEGKRHRTFSEL